MRNKPSFAALPGGQAAAHEAPSVSILKPKTTSGVKHVTLRLRTGDWKRIHDFALTHETSIQALALAGISKLMQDAGLQPLEGGDAG
jgi:hypothetical protein